MTWDSVELAPVVLVSGAEHLLSERAVAALIAAARERAQDVEVTQLEGAAYTRGMLGVVTSPSLFGEARVVVVQAVEQATPELITDALDYLAQPADDVVLVLVHRGGQRGKKLLDAVRAAGAPVVTCEPIKKDADKVAFAAAELRRAGRRADAQAVRALVEAVGADLRELAAACAQLAVDTTGVIGADVVARYYGGRIEATGFRVADAAIAGQTGQAVVLLRHALATGADPVPLVAAIAAKLRVLAKVAATRGRGAVAVRDLGLAPWQVDRALRDLSRWTPEGLAAAITAVAQADAEVKGAGRDPVFAVERAVLRVAAAANR
ncbi:DNA polymerase III subunit delta [Pengzhenrongella sicca]|uniref:DNA-directed DNA polymerase n=1 Tax=Pengzhenrongella sicca TaxID=2819238 RepID=A0A8A4ZHK4_9MICO|nr:DNA polymerase III subunit delta [Pengzhenrongella sicca]QTE31530.1 DNA polymerase III subunit delta [Pengzhenrongella sicca]